MRKRYVVAILVAGVVVAVAWTGYQTFYPSDSFYREEFELATSRSLPASANLVKECSEWSATAAVYEIPTERWESFSEPLLERAVRGETAKSGCEPALLDALDSQADIFVLDTKRRFVLVGLDSTRQRVFWEVWHS